MRKEIFECDLDSCHCQITDPRFMFKIKSQSAIGFNNDLVEFRGVDLRKGQDDLHFCSLPHLLEFIHINIEKLVINEYKRKSENL